MHPNLAKPNIPIIEVKEIGVVEDVKHGIARVKGLPSCGYGQLVKFSQGTKGLVTGFNPEEVFVIVLGEETSVFVGDKVSSLAELITVPVGEAFLNRVVNSLGEPLDGKGDIQAADNFAVFQEALGVMEREPITEPLITGIKAIDLVLPLGKGQRELIIGDRQTGKTSICTDAIINQKGQDMVCIYCWIGGPKANLKKILHSLNLHDALKYTIVVSSSAESSAAEQYLAPYTAAALGEYFMFNGKHVLVIFDDLTKHAWMYRQMSLLLERYPGREAYPGDIFYLHSSLLERAGKLRKERGGGSMTFLPVAETLQGDITGYIQTNLISITDGQIYINSSLFREGVKPAIDLGLSVSRIGSRVQYPGIKEVSQGLRLEYSRYREMLRLTKLRTRLSTEAAEQMRRGDILRQLFIQSNNQPLSAEEEIVLFYAFKRKILESLSPDKLEIFIADFFRKFLLVEEPDFILRLKENRELSSEIKAELDQLIVKFFRKAKEQEQRVV